jgi:hypothetical protein
MKSLNYFERRALKKAGLIRDTKDAAIRLEWFEKDIYIADMTNILNRALTKLGLEKNPVKKEIRVIDDIDPLTGNIELDHYETAEFYQLSMI